MVNFCAVVSCGNNAAKTGFTFHRIPATKRTLKNENQANLLRKRRAAWIRAIRRSDLDESRCHNYRVCGNHFLSGKPAELEEINHPDWSPSINLGYRTTTTMKDLKRYERTTTRTVLENPVPSDALTETTVQHEEPPTSMVETVNMEDLGETHLEVNSTIGVETQIDETEFTSAEVQTDFTGQELKSLQDELLSANRTIYQLRDTVASLEMNDSSFKNDKEKLTFYTGIPSWAIFTVLFLEMSQFITITSTCSLNKFQQLLLTLMRLRLNVPFTDLGYRFNVSRRTASRVFYKVLNILYIRLDRCIAWPEREQLRLTMPKCFREAFGTKIAIIIDCFEIFIERPSNLIAKGQTWSNYKHHNTTKYLIGISPQGVISYISEGWGGRTSDKHITENCGLLKNLLPGDVVLADRGFNISEAVGFHCATVNIPAFTKGKPQLHPKDVEDTRQIASVRIHVERVIGTVRQKYQILSGTLPIEMLSNNGTGSAIDQIVQVCCALVNLCPSVVPFQ